MKRIGYCCQSVIPVRANPSHRGEMVTQLLFGELYAVTEVIQGWAQISSLSDGYEGWIEEKQLNCLKNNNIDNNSLSAHYIDGITARASAAENPGQPIYLLYGTLIRGYQEGGFLLDGTQYQLEGALKSVNEITDIQSIINVARRFLGAPYLWGGRTLFGVDCSGLIQQVFLMNGITLPRDASNQAQQGKGILSLKEVSPGDLAFFGDQPGKITHVGIVLPEGRIIHASGQVRIDDLVEEGIFDVVKKEISHHLRLIKRIID